MSLPSCALHLSQSKHHQEHHNPDGPAAPAQVIAEASRMAADALIRSAVAMASKNCSTPRTKRDLADVTNVIHGNGSGCNSKRHRCHDATKQGNVAVAKQAPATTCSDPAATPSPTALIMPGFRGKQTAATAKDGITQNTKQASCQKNERQLQQPDRKQSPAVGGMAPCTQPQSAAATLASASGCVHDQKHMAHKQQHHKQQGPCYVNKKHAAKHKQQHPQQTQHDTIPSQQQRQQQQQQQHMRESSPSSHVSNCIHQPVRLQQAAVGCISQQQPQHETNQGTAEQHQLLDLQLLPDNVSSHDEEHGAPPLLPARNTNTQHKPSPPAEQLEQIHDAVLHLADTGHIPNDVLSKVMDVMLAAAAGELPKHKLSQLCSMAKCLEVWAKRSNQDELLKMLGRMGALMSNQDEGVVSEHYRASASAASACTAAAAAVPSCLDAALLLLVRCAS
eukprot:jgi/Chrzof1/2745/Cz11g27190.t1